MSNLHANIKNVLLKAPDSQLDASMQKLVKEWNDPPTALQVLEVLDRSIFSSLASSIVITILQLAYEDALKNEKVTHEDLLPKAAWRDDP